MTRDLLEKSSVEAAIKEAQRAGAPTEVARQVHELVKANTAPHDVKTFEVTFGSDSVNNKAGWVHLIVDEDLRPTDERITELNNIVSKVRNALLSARLEFRPYVDVRGRS